MVKQHNAQRTNHLPRRVAQRNAANHKGTGPVGQQVDEDGLASLQHLVHLGVVHHHGNRVADKVFFALKTQRRQKPFVLLVDPDHAGLAVYQHHAFAGAGEQRKHGARRQLQDALGVARQGVGGGHAAMLTQEQPLNCYEFRSCSRIFHKR